MSVRRRLMEDKYGRTRVERLSGFRVMLLPEAAPLG